MSTPTLIIVAWHLCDLQNKYANQSAKDYNAMFSVSVMLYTLDSNIRLCDHLNK